MLLNNKYSQTNNFNSSSSFFLTCYASDFSLFKVSSSKRYYGATIKVFADPISLLGGVSLFGKTASAAAATCPTPTAMYPDINLQNYIVSVVKGTLYDLTAPMLWQLLFYFCTTILVGYGMYSIISHATEIYQIIQFYKQIVASPELVSILNDKFEVLNHFNRDSAIKISNLTYGLMAPDDCQLIVKFCINNSEYTFHGILMDISNSNMI